MQPLLRYRPGLGPLVASLLAMALLTAVRAESELERRKAAFEAKAAELTAPIEKLERQYLDHLKRQEDERKQAGDLKGMLAVEEEQKSPGAAAAIAGIPALKRAQDVFLENRKALTARQLEKRVLFYKQYQISLTAYQVELTKADNIPEAKLVLAEVERVEALAAELKVAPEVPADGESAPSVAQAAGTDAPGPSANDSKIDLNSATIAELKTLPGIGDVMAQRIIDGRPFKSADDILDIEGVGDATLKKIKDLIIAK